MATIKKPTTAVTDTDAWGEMVEFTVPRNMYDPKEKDMYVSVNFRNYILKRGATVKIPKPLVEAIKNSLEAEEKALDYAVETEYKDPVQRV